MIIQWPLCYRQYLNNANIFTPRIIELEDTTIGKQTAFEVSLAASSTTETFNFCYSETKDHWINSMIQLNNNAIILQLKPIFLLRCTKN